MCKLRLDLMTQDRKIIKSKLGLLKLAQTLGSVSEACTVLGFGRDSCSRFRELYETGVAQEGDILTEEQVHALEKARQEKEAHGEIETEHPGYLGAQDRHYVGTINRRGPDLPADLHRHLQNRRIGK